MFVFAVVCIEVWNTQMPVWALVLGLIICERSQQTAMYLRTLLTLPLQHSYIPSPSV